MNKQMEKNKMTTSNKTMTNKQYEEKIKHLRSLVDDLYSFSYLDEMIDDFVIERKDDKDDERLICALITKSQVKEVLSELYKENQTQRGSKK
jgi:hypothetical protein